MTKYIHELPDWPRFRWSLEALAQRLADVRHKQGFLLGRMQALGFSLRAEAVLQTLTLDVLKSSEIEGAALDRDQVRSSVARRLGVDVGALAPGYRNVDGVVDMMLDATQNHEKSLTKGRLLSWHASLFPAGYSGLRKINVGAWRDDAKGPMQVVSGPVGRERVHFEAPAAARLEQEMAAFLDWFNRDDGTDLVLRAGIAHLWFVIIHPFDDGNGRIARALADMMLARSEGSPQRFYSMSAQIRVERDAYYGGLEETQKGTLDITERLEWFLACLDRALDGAESTLAAVLRKARFWESSQSVPFNERQRLLLNMLLDGFDGKLATSKWARIAKCSQDTALRDILDLVKRGILTKAAAGGRSSSYSLKEFSDNRDVEL
jgi:Fic family protein